MNNIDTMNTLYHILDGNGDYYRVNEKDQLVVADSREEAGVFTFTEANQRIGGGKKAHFYSVIPAVHRGRRCEGGIHKTTNHI